MELREKHLRRVSAYFCGSKNPFKISTFLAELGQFDSLIENASPSSADFLFADHSPGSLREMLSIPDTGQIRVLLAREAVSPDFNLFDYAISFDASLESRRHFRPHTLLTFAKDARLVDKRKMGQDRSTSFAGRAGFCDFVYGNSRAHPMRGRIFSELSLRFSGVESLGKQSRKPRFFRKESNTLDYTSHWRSEKISFQENFLFSIAAENAMFPGYTTEKLLHPFAAGSIPIYWGNPQVSEEFNPDRFIQLQGDDFDELEETILKIYQNEDTWVEITRQPLLTLKQQSHLEENRAQLIEWFTNFFREEPRDLQVRPRGWYPDWYAGVIRTGYLAQIVSPARIHGALRSLTRTGRS